SGEVTRAVSARAAVAALPGAAPGAELSRAARRVSAAGAAGPGTAFVAVGPRAAVSAVVGATGFGRAGRLRKMAGVMAIAIIRRIAQTVRRSMCSGHGVRGRDRSRPDETDGIGRADGRPASCP